MIRGETMTEKNNGGIDLLNQEHFNMENPRNKPVVGWKPTSDGIGGLFNPQGWAALRAVLYKITPEQLKQWLYDQILVVENPGSIVIMELDGRIGLVQNFRMIGDRLLPKAAGSYIKTLNEEKLWQKLLDTLGRWSWEAPRGLINDPETDDIKKFILKTARVEALEETGFTLSEARIVGPVNANTTFFAHSQYIVYGKIESMGEANPEDLEIIGTSKLFTLDQLRELNKSGEFVDGLTLAGMALCGFSL